MRSAQRYLFDRSFETETPGRQFATARPEANDTPPVYTSEDLARARAEGVALGRAEALAERNIELEIGRLRQATLDAIASRMGELLAHSAEASEQAARDAVTIAARIAGKLLPRLYRERACSELQELIAGVLAKISDAPKVVVRISPTLVGELAPMIEASIAGGDLDHRLAVLGDPALEEGDCRIDWSGGGVIRDQALLWREIEALLADCVTPGVQHSLGLPSPTIPSGETHV